MAEDLKKPLARRADGATRWAIATPPAILLGLGTALPKWSVTSEEVARFLGEVGAHRGEPKGYASKLRRLAAASGVDRRYSVVADYQRSDPADFELFGKSWDLEPLPGTAARMKVYEAEAVPLAAEAARRALASAGVSANEVTHLVITSCTGFFAPGPDAALIKALGLSTSVERTIVGFMGCYAGLTGIRLADKIVRADPASVVLEVSVELSSLHVQPHGDLRAVLPNLLFGDGAGATVWSSARPGIGRYLGGQSLLAPDSTESMTWRIGDHGFEMHLDARVPEALEAATLPFVAGLLERHGLNRDEIVGWAIHPGGKRIVECVGRSLGLAPDELEPSLETLRAIGNVSSATIFFVLERLRARAQNGPVVLLAFGPGLTLEGAVLELG